MAEITDFQIFRFYPPLRPAETYFYLYAARELIFVKMWPSNEFEFETPGLIQDLK